MWGQQGQHRLPQLMPSVMSSLQRSQQEAHSLVPGSQARPADIFLPSWSLGHSAALDVHVISPFQELTIAEATLAPGHALQVGVQHKFTPNLSACHASGI